MLKIYHVPGTRSVRPVWLCYELDIPFEIEVIDFSPDYRNSAAWREISPAGKVPAMSDGSLTLFESGAMVETILDRYGERRLRPSADSPDLPIYRQWCWFAEATLSRPLGFKVLSRDPKEDLPTLAMEKANDAIGAVETALSDRDFLLGTRFSAADIMTGYSLLLLERFGVLKPEYRSVNEYLMRLKEREAFRQAV